MASSFPSGKKQSLIPLMSIENRMKDRKSNIPLARTSSTKSMGKLSCNLTRVSLSKHKVSPSKHATPGQNKLPLPSHGLLTINRNTRNSIRSSRMGMEVKKTPWPLGNSSFRTKCIDEVYNFLCTQQAFLNKNILKAPSTKEFKEIFCTIYGQLDPSYNITRIEDQVPQLLKALGYPFQMPKSTFLSVGSPHCWPSVLAMLAWLVSLVNGTQSPIEDMIFEKEFDNELDKRQLKLKYLSKAHIDDNENLDQCLEEYAAEIRQGAAFTTEQMEKALKARDELKQRLEQTPSNADKLALIRKRYDQIQNDTASYKKYNEDLQTYIQRKDQERVDLQKKLNSLREDNEKLLLREKDLQNLKETQKYTLDELRRLKNHASYSKKLVSHLHEQETELNKRGWDLELQISKCVEKVNNDILSFRTRFMKFCENVPIFSHTEISRYENEIREYVAKVLADITAKAEHSTQEYHRLKSASEQSLQSLVSIKNENKKMEVRIKCCQDELDAVKQKMETEKSRLQEQFEAVTLELSTARKSVPSVTEIKDRKNTLQHEYKIHEERYQRTFRDGLEKIETAIKVLEKVQKKLQILDRDMLHNIQKRKYKYLQKHR